MTRVIYASEFPMRSIYLAMFCGVLLLASCEQSATPPQATTTMKLPRPRTTVNVPHDDFTRGIYYFSGWTYVSSANGYTGREIPPERTDGNEWWLIANDHNDKGEDYHVDRTPTSGFVDENQQWIADQQISQMGNAGFTYVAYQMGWSHNKWRANHADPARVYFDYALRNHISSPNAQLLKFAITWHDVQAQDPAYWTTPTTWTTQEYLDDMSALFHTWFDRYITASPYYYKVHGTRPLIIFWGAQDMRSLNWLASPKQVVALLRQVAAGYGYSGAATPFLLATAVPDNEYFNIASWGFDGVSAYVWEGNGTYASIMEVYSGYPGFPVGCCGKWGFVKNQVAGTSLKFYVPTVAGEDGRPWRFTNRGIPTTSQFTDHLTQAETFAAAWPSLTEKNVILCCWNEFGEGEYIQPTVERGSDLLDAYRSTVQWP
jgi:hypothetical protein